MKKVEIKDNHYSYNYWLKRNDAKNEQTSVIKDIDDLIFADETIKTHSER